MDNKMQILIAVAVTAVICVAGTYVLVGEKNSNMSMTVTGSTTVQPLMVSFQEEFEKYSSIRLNVSGGGSSVGINNIADGIADIGMSSRDLTAAELGKGLIPVSICRDAVVVIVDKDAGVTNLTLAQLAKIYSKEYTNWNQVGGADLSINPIIREAGSGTRDCIDTIMGTVSGFSNGNYSGYSTQSTTGAMLAQASVVNGAIGYVNLGSIPDLTSAVNTVTIDGVMPSATSVLDGTYEISRTLLLVTRGQPGYAETFFFNWILSPQGQKIVEKEGFVPIGPTA